ncbi:methionine biosynthesis protein MetW [Nocardia tenerifensis]|uniref:Methionine biosynthesis protein MetW n=1 Tax=Nocardia tenerifensis TaxID=228006 RepID=A0A318K394_9NOCA|nr:class I SAM-dependent methyltransferase [Nocardia tenerifensis]PXX56470.1 methionine biosynthesis protein MetW [Nocardia tenerifensis]
MSTSLIYRNATVYELLIRALYGRYYTARYRAVAALVPEGAGVVDLCCGPATLYTRYLRAKSVHYTGLDRNERFVGVVDRAGGHGKLWNLNSDATLPAADYVVMQASLYHFLPDPAPVLDRMLAAAGKQVIIAEPVRNMASSENRVLAAVGRRFTDAGDGVQAHRFTEATLDAFFRRYESHVVHQELIAGGREKLYVLEP